MRRVRTVRSILNTACFSWPLGAVKNRLFIWKKQKTNRNCFGGTLHIGCVFVCVRRRKRQIDRERKSERVRGMRERENSTGSRCREGER